MIYIQKLKELRAELISEENMMNCLNLLTQHGWVRDIEKEKDSRSDFKVFKKIKNGYPKYVEMVYGSLLLEDEHMGDLELITVDKDGFEKHFEEKIEVDTKPLVELFNEIYSQLEGIKDETLRVDTTWKIIKGGRSE